LLFALGTFLVRREREAQAPLVTPSPSTELKTGSADIEIRLDQIERLAMVGEPWCIYELKENYFNDPDERIRNAAEDAMLVIRARGHGA